MDRLILTTLILCFTAEAAILILDLAYNLTHAWYAESLKRMTNVDVERSFGTWFSVVQNFLVGLAALVLALHYGFIDPRKGKTAGWLIVACFFAYISLDDHLVLHENIGSAAPVIMERLLGKTITLPTYGWHVVFGPVFGAFGIFFLVFICRELTGWKYRLILVGGLFLWSLAVGLDAWDGTNRPYEGLATLTGFKDAHIRHFSMLVEEMFEMVGSTLFLYLFLSHLKVLLRRRETYLKLS